MDLSFVYNAYCDEAKAVFLCLTQKKKSQIRLNLRLLAEMVGFEPTCPIKDKTISSHFSLMIFSGNYAKMEVHNGSQNSAVYCGFRLPFFAFI